MYLSQSRWGGGRGIWRMKSSSPCGKQTAAPGWGCECWSRRRVHDRAHRPWCCCRGTGGWTRPPSCRLSCACNGICLQKRHGYIVVAMLPQRFIARRPSPVGWELHVQAPGLARRHDMNGVLGAFARSPLVSRASSISLNRSRRTAAREAPQVNIKPRPYPTPPDHQRWWGWGWGRGRGWCMRLMIDDDDSGDNERMSRCWCWWVWLSPVMENSICVPSHAISKQDEFQKLLSCQTHTHLCLVWRLIPELIETNCAGDISRLPCLQVLWTCNGSLNISLCSWVLLHWHAFFWALLLTKAS